MRMLPSSTQTRSSLSYQKLQQLEEAHIINMSESDACYFYWLNKVMLVSMELFLLMNAVWFILLPSIQLSMPLY